MDERLPVIVFTNSRDDYRVTVRSPGFPPEAVRLIEAMARDAWPHVDSAAFGCAVGAVACPGAAGRILAFRVFDAGTYRGRPHTIAVAGVLVGPRAGRPWGLGELLADLPAPRPDDDRYAAFPPPPPGPGHDPAGAGTTSAGADAALGRAAAAADAWEAGVADAAGEVPSVPFFYGEPESVRFAVRPPATADGAAKRGGRGRLPVYLIAAVVSAVALIIAVAIFRAVAEGRRSPSGDADVATSPAVYGPADRSEFQRAMARGLVTQCGGSSRLLDAGADPAALAAIAVRTAPEVERRVDGLRSALALLKDVQLSTRERAERQDAALGKFLEASRTPIDWGADPLQQAAAPPARDRAAAALRAHRTYGWLIRAAEAARHFPVDSPEFRGHVVEVESLLKR